MLQQRHAALEEFETPALCRPQTQTSIFNQVCVSVPLQLTGEVELDVLWLKSADPGRPPNAGSEALWRESSSSNGPVNVSRSVTRAVFQTSAAALSKTKSRPTSGPAHGDLPQPGGGAAGEAQRRRRMARSGAQMDFMGLTWN